MVTRDRNQWLAWDLRQFVVSPSRMPNIITGKDYLKLVTPKYGWANVPPGVRRELYDNSDYLEVAPFAELTLESMKNADLQHPAVQPVPYEGIQYVGIPSFQSIGTAAGYQMNDALTDDVTAKKALENSQWTTGRVIKRTGKIDDTQSSD